MGPAENAGPFRGQLGKQRKATCRDHPLSNPLTGILVSEQISVLPGFWFSPGLVPGFPFPWSGV